MRIRFLRSLIPALALAALPAISSAGVFVGVSVNIAPPALPVYVQPPCPEPGYLWSPGYWAWDDDAGSYYWVPGTWVLPPQVGFLWTPGYWGWGDGVYLWHAGYWGPHVGFYGGVHYGFGYDGAGFEGGYWHRGVFMYNRAVVHVGPTFVTNVYSRPVVYHSTYAHVSFNGGPGGVMARPTREQVGYEHEHHIAYTSVQQRQEHMAFADRSLRANYNHGRPPIAATARPAVFHGSGVLAARAAGGHYAPSHSAAPMRSDRPSWAAGQSHARPMERSAPAHAQSNFSRPQQHFEARPQNNYRSMQRPQPQQHFESRPQNNYRSMQRPQPQQHFEARPQPQYHQQSRPQQGGAPAMRSAPREQQRGGGGARPHGAPQDHRGGGHNR